MIQLIVECTLGEEWERMLTEIGTVKYRLPLIQSYVVEVPEDTLPALEGMDGVKAVHQNARITAQMNVARKAVKVDAAEKARLTGHGIGIAILDTGVAPVEDLTMPVNRIVAFHDVVNSEKVPYDDNGHGTHVAGIAAGSGRRSGGRYMGIAPQSHIVAIKILDRAGRGNTADVLAGIQWMMDNRKAYNIRIANLSVGTVDNGDRDPLVKAVEAAWDAGVVIAVAAGNNGPQSGSVTSPGISRKVLTIGASDDHKLVEIWGSTLENFSGRGPTQDCIVKPDLVAPGSGIISCCTPTPHMESVGKTAAKIISPYYMQLSGTSMSTPIVSGAIALLLEQSPELRPNEVKLILKKSVNCLQYSQNQQGWGLLDIEKMLRERLVCRTT